MPSRGEPGGGVAHRSHVNDAPTRHEEDVVEQRHDAAPGLVDAAYHGAAFFSGQLPQGFHDALRLKRVQPRRGLVRAHHRGRVPDQLARERQTLLLTSADAARLFVADARIADVRETQAVEHRRDGSVSVRARRSRGHAQLRSHCQGFFHRQLGVEDILLLHVRCTVRRHAAPSAAATHRAAVRCERSYERQPLVRGHLHGEGVEQRCFARARGTHDGEEAPGLCDAADAV
mmetsp:Transcript_12161/g.29464  ORF Transcript_12161/g.29464 Transcript_12161/m.29464 type:complete len:231 (+) Transcript_12161:1558-2250(+)